MIKYKGRLYFRQYMPKKPVKYGIKVWMAADSKTGYVYTMISTWGNHSPVPEVKLG